jgi:hypothetical protein
MALRKYSNQGEMWGPSPDLALPAGHPARAIDEIIERLNPGRCNRRHLHTAGEPAYDVRGMVKILIYAYMRGITSSREMARQCEENIAFQFLTRGHGPDSEQLNPMLQVVERTAGQAPEQLVADSGYYTDDAVLEASRSKTDCVVPDSETRGSAEQSETQ